MQDLYWHNGTARCAVCGSTGAADSRTPGTAAGRESWTASGRESWTFGYHNCSTPTRRPGVHPRWRASVIASRAAPRIARADRLSPSAASPPWPVIASLISPERCCEKHPETSGGHSGEPTRERISTTGVGARSRSVTAGGSCSPVFIHMCGDRFYWVYNRSRQSCRTRLDYLQRLVNWVRWLQVTDLLPVREGELPNPWPRPAIRS
jgi:hypothetical protein